MSKMRYCVSALFALSLNFVLLLTVASGTVFAHAKVDSSTPGIGAVVSTAPTSVSVHTLENMKPGAQFSNLFVYGPDGALISQGDAKIALSTPNEMAATIKPEKDGIYIVRWITVSADDGDPDQGAFTFTVKSATTGSATTAPASTTNTNTFNTPASTTNAATSNTATTFPTLPVIITGIIALLVGLGAGFGLGRNRTIPATAQTSSEKVETSDTDRVVH
jgi:methionine-rich copper-binding protein CopC